MASPNPPCLMIKIFLLFLFSIVIIGLTLAVVSCEAKHFETLSQSSLNPKSKHRYNDFVLPRYNLLMQDSINAVSVSSEDFGENGVLSREINTIDRNLQSTTSSCQGLLSLASYDLNMSRRTLADSKANICAALAYIDTCLDGFEYAPEKARKLVSASLGLLRENVGNSLSTLSTIDNLGSINGGSGAGNAWPPSWMSSEERKVFDMKTTRIDVVVAKDGLGMFKTIREAIKVAPQNSKKRFVIYVKWGIYYENVRIDASRWNIMMFGDGMDKTIVSGKLCNRTGSTTIDSATFAVYGRGFVARDMGFENTAGPSSSQAVALLSTSDQSVLYKCSIRGYQDALFAASNRQFYRECKISGTVDFIFGRSTTVFQKCTILVRKPARGQANVITAQGRVAPQCSGGFSFHNCHITAAENLARTRTFLGRPWRRYATTVFLDSFLGRLIDRQGWSAWNSSDTPPRTVYYGEYRNRGPGSVTAGKAKRRRSMSAAEAKKFTVREFIGGAQWLPATGVPFQPDL